MRNIFFATALVLFALLSCRSDEDSVQNIDQILNIYIKNSAGQDLLNAKKNGSFSGYNMTDIFGTVDNAPVNNTLKVTADSLYYIEYIAGARRVTLDSVSPDNRTYRSRINVSLRRTQNNVTDTINDILEIQYRWTPSVFEVSKVYYNNDLKFTKQPGSPNVVTIIK